MQGRRLATTDELIAIVSPDSDATLERLETWCDERGVGFSAVDVGRDIAAVYDENRATLGVALGGDGTYLEGIKSFAPRKIPLLGVNTGTLSFLARVEPEDLEGALDEVVSGRASVDSRQQVTVRTAELTATGINDVTVEHVPPEDPFERKITRLAVYANDEYVGEFEGTGLAVATPTGSTGLSLSANGPVHYPVDNHSLELVPLHTHNLGVRPVVVAPSTDVRIVTNGPATLLVDGGREQAIVTGGDEITVTGADRLAHVVRTSYDDGFFTAISTKLGWGARGQAPPRSPPPTARARATAPETTVERARRIAVDAARSAGDSLRDLHGRVESVEVKSGKSDLVTEADHQADRIITTVIDNEFPSHSIYSEESPTKLAESSYTWVVDPLDGTGNFAHGNPNYAVSIALLDAGEPVVGVVYVPETDELFSAVAGEGAYRDGSEISTTSRGRLERSMLLSGYDPDGSFLATFYQQTRGVRRLGSAALNCCYLASGSADAIWEYDTYPWDVAAGILIAHEAGATLTDETGIPFEVSLDDDDRTPLLGSNGPLHETLLDYLDIDPVDAA